MDGVRAGVATALGTTTSGTARAKVLAITLGWAAVNLAAYAADRRA